MKLFVYIEFVCILVLWKCLIWLGKVLDIKVVLIFGNLLLIVSSVWIVGSVFC